MTGMKEGAGEDPFAEDPDPQDESDVDDGREAEEATGTVDGAKSSDDSAGVEVDDAAKDDRSSVTGGATDPDAAAETTGEAQGTADQAPNSRGSGRGSAGESISEESPGRGPTTEGGTGTTGGARGSAVTATGEGTFDVPYKLRRDSVQDGRKRVPLFLQDETKAAEREVLRELEDRFGDNVSLTDLREALILVGMGRLDEVEDQLERWGYGMTFEV